MAGKSKKQLYTYVKYSYSNMLRINITLKQTLKTEQQFRSFENNISLYMYLKLILRFKLKFLYGQYRPRWDSLLLQKQSDACWSLMRICAVSVWSECMNVYPPCTAQWILWEQTTEFTDYEMFILNDHIQKKNTFCMLTSWLKVLHRQILWHTFRSFGPKFWIAALTFRLVKNRKVSPLRN